MRGGETIDDIWKTFKSPKTNRGELSRGEKSVTNSNEMHLLHLTTQSAFPTHPAKKKCQRRKPRTAPFRSVITALKLDLDPSSETRNPTHEERRISAFHGLTSKPLTMCMVFFFLFLGVVHNFYDRVGRTKFGYGGSRATCELTKLTKPEYPGKSDGS